ncbi:MAG: hypothetical protein A4E66_02046 [Syntrophus sp. PtaB.Bin001]|nr:MAG: hypothetical protein A4E66_02046 [Syntrophus sp. PtaB.Bin001]
MPKEIADPITSFGEEAVENTAARALAAWQTEDVFELLIKLASSRNLAGVIETLGLFRRKEAIPVFIAALKDDICGGVAEQALHLLGEIAKSALIAILSEASEEEFNSPSELLRKKRAIRILMNLPLNSDEWKALRKLLHDEDLELTVLASMLALDVGGNDDKAAALDNLIEAIPRARWDVQIEVEQCLMKHFDFARDRVEEEIIRRSKSAGIPGAEDSVLQLLLNIQKRKI